MSAARRSAAWCGMAGVLLVLCACSTATTGSPAPAGVDGMVTVLAAASLSEPFEEIARQFETEHPAAEVRLSFGGSSGLAQQVLHGAPADVLATASVATMAPVLEAGRTADPPRVFASNVLTIAVPPDNPADIRGLEDLTDPERTIALCAREVPCGAAGQELFTAAGLTATPDTLEQDVKAVLAKVLLGEVDAGLVYVTDVLAAGGDVDSIPVPGAASAGTDYPVAALTEAPNAAAATAFVEFVLGPQGAEVLRDAGFGTP